MNKHNVIKLNQQLKRVEIKDFEIANDIVFSYFDNLPSAERDEQLFKAIYIGVLALLEDRFSAFLAKTQNELGAELESLKILFDMKKEVFYKTSIKGSLAEEEIASYLEEYLQDRKIQDKVKLTGNEKGTLPRNKTGDIVCEVGGNKNVKISIECKFDKSIKLGDVSTKDIFTRNIDTAWSQLLEAQANRDSRVSIVVFDISFVDKSILEVCDNVKYVPQVGFISIIDSQKSDFRNLSIAYMLSRDIAINAKEVELDQNILAILINRIVKDVSEILKIRSLVEQNIQNNKAILKQIEKSMLLAEFSQRYLIQFLNEGTLSKEDLLAFYQSEDIKNQYSLIEKDISNL